MNDAFITAVIYGIGPLLTALIVSLSLASWCFKEETKIESNKSSKSTRKEKH